MSGATMAKSTRGAKKSDTDQSSGKTMRVGDEAHDIVTKLTALRGLKGTKEFFEESDVREFFTHLLLSELKTEEQRHQAPRQSK